MSKSNQRYKELAIPYFKEVFDIIDSVLNTHEAPYYLIGVNVINLELLKKATNQEEKRKTSTLQLSFLSWSGVPDIFSIFK